MTMLWKLLVVVVVVVVWSGSGQGLDLRGAGRAVEDRSRTVLAKRDDVPATDQFLRRASTAAIVVGDYVYIDGGEVSRLQDGRTGPNDHPSYAVNGTLSLPLTRSWDTASATFIQRPKSAPVLNRQAVWRDPSGTGFYIWGGATAYSASPPPPEIWKFTVDGSGGGSWAKEDPRGRAAAALASTVRATDGAWAQSKDVGYYVGGKATGSTDANITGDNAMIPLPGLTAFNMTSGELTNSSAAGLSLYGTLVGGVAEFVPFGSSGLLLFLGGSYAPVVTSTTQWATVGFDSLTLYDPSRRVWYSQQTSGDRPSKRERFCVVGVQGPNGTYEIFMYGGITTADYKASGDVYILSLPGFVFFKATPSSTSTKRAEHACVLAGNRQMLSVGGIDIDLSFPEVFFDPDPWKNGLGVLDLTALTWGARYDAKAQPYESPEVVKQWYAKGSLASVKWTSDTVRGLFAQGAPPGTTSDPKGAPPEDETSVGTPGPKSSKTGGSPISSGAIGGIVAGVVGGLGLGLILAWVFLKYKKRRAAAKAKGETVKSFSWSFRTKTPPKLVNKKPAELKAEDVTPPCELAGGHSCELAGGHSCELVGGHSCELAGEPLRELDGGHAGGELDGHSPESELTAGHGMSEMESNDPEVQPGSPRNPGA
ncbi:hypothetical protein QBC39DRAFT_99475 [Podospora conica]|nr:hypothetical protein QBC39DRAFT_99475 [Schizothecium conicum]